MPVDSQHPEFVEYHRLWKRCRDAFGGVRTIKGAKNCYLKALDSMTDSEYEDYLERATWYGATRRTIEGMTGAIMRKEPTVTTTDKDMKKFMENVTLTGRNLASFAKMVVQELWNVGRGGILCDMPPADGSDIRPYWSFYRAENIINWRTRVINGVTDLSEVVLQECVYEPRLEDPFIVDEVIVYRRLFLTPNNRYQVDTYRRVPEAGRTVVKPDSSYMPVFRGQPLDYIPFTFVNPLSTDPCIEDPPLIDVVDINISHYKTSADYEHGLHYCGLPTPVVAGFDKNSKLRIGSSVAWVSEEPTATATYLEFTGQGLGALREALQHKERQMAVLGARLLEAQQPAPEAFDSQEMRSSGERSILQSTALSVSQALTQHMHWTMYWMGKEFKPEDHTISLNTDFHNIRMTPEEQAQNMAEYQSGAITFETFYWRLERGGMTRPGVDAEEEKKLLESRAPVVVPGAEGLTDDQEYDEDGKPILPKPKEKPPLVGNA